MKAILSVALALPLAACLSFGPKVPATLMSLTADARAPAGADRSGTDRQALGVAVPTAPASVSTLRVPVQASPTAVAYLKDAQWVEPPARLFRHLLAETIEARTGRIVPDFRQSAIAPTMQLSGRLEAFGLDAAGPAAVVVYDAFLSTTGQDQVRTRRFEARVPVAAVDAASAPDAINRAANQVATEVADWVGQ